MKGYLDENYNKISCIILLSIGAVSAFSSAVIAFLSLLSTKKATIFHANKDQWLADFKFTDNHNDLDTYSTGMKKIVGFLSAFVNDPAYVILDELFEGVDEDNTGLMLQIIRSYHATGTTFLITTHRLDLLQSVTSDRIVLG